MEKDKYENDRFPGKCPTCGQAFCKEVLEAAKALIDSWVADQDTMRLINRNYVGYINAIGNMEGADLNYSMEKKKKRKHAAIDRSIIDPCPACGGQQYITRALTIYCQAGCKIKPLGKE